MTTYEPRRLPKSTSPEQRFDILHIPEPTSGCWLWVGSEAHFGYGRMKIGGRAVLAHRFSYQRHRGTIPDGMWVLHRCDNPACVNPDHLFLGTHQDNEDDKLRKGRQSKGAAHSAAKVNPARGERNARAKITRDQAEEIRESSESQRALARRFGISQMAVWRIKTGKTWQ